MRLNVRMKLLATSGLMLLAMLVITVGMALSLSDVNAQADRTLTEGTAAVDQLGSIRVALADKTAQVEYDLALGGTAAAGQARIDAQIAADDATIAAQLATFEKLPLDDAEKAALADFRPKLDAYSIAFTKFYGDAKAGNMAPAFAELQAESLAGDAMLASLDKLTAAARTHAQALNDGIQAIFEQSRMIAVICLLIALVVGLFFSIKVSGGILAGVKAVQETLTSMTDICATALEAGLGALAQNDLSVEAHAATAPIERHGTDEIGQTAAVTNNLLAKLRSTIESYETARASLAGTIGQVKAASEAMSGASGQLDAIAAQSGQTAQQVARTINQVAAGAGDQATAAGQTSGASHDLTAIIERVGEGAASTRIRIQDASRALSATTRAIGQAMNDSEEMAPLNERVEAAVVAGAMAVDETASGMLRIKSSVEVTAARVTELGAKGEQIGAIVETIDDIAEQTNLLALNAAIEAARAGEQGKGFAVVADEVRKLAERSSRATKEIADLIAEVQAGTEQAVKAMQIGAREVESGADLASKSGAALDDIASAVESSNAAVARIVKAMEDMQQSSTGLVSASDAIAAIAQETNAAAESMTGSAEQVANAVESIAAISEENSASAEEVSAATEQMSAQAEEVVGSASTLADMAAQLEGLAGRFKLAASGSGVRSAEPAMLPGTTAERRRRAA
jgi:methyl-accepting chemotaxis protein